jgi:hypothetical protein
MNAEAVSALALCVLPYGPEQLVGEHLGACFDDQMTYLLQFDSQCNIMLLLHST